MSETQHSLCCQTHGTSILRYFNVRIMEGRKERESLMFVLVRWKKPVECGVKLMKN